MLHLQTVIAVISGETFRNKQYKILGCFIWTLIMKYRLKSLFNFISNMYEAYSHVGYLLSLIPYSVILNCVVVCLVKAAKSKIKKKTIH